MIINIITTINNIFALLRSMIAIIDAHFFVSIDEMSSCVKFVNKSSSFIFFVECIVS